MIQCWKGHGIENLNIEEHCSSNVSLSIEHSKNKVIAYFENEVVPGLLQTSVQQICYLQQFQTRKTGSKHGQWPGFLPLAFLQKARFLNARLEHSRCDFDFEQLRLCNNLIFGMIYS